MYKEEENNSSYFDFILSFLLHTLFTMLKMAQPTTYPILNTPQPIYRSEDDDAMHVEKLTQSGAPMQVGFDGDMIARMIPSLIKKGRHGLSSMSQHTLQQSLEPIVNALSRLDAELLLDLQASKDGPQVHEGYVAALLCCRSLVRILSKHEPAKIRIRRRKYVFARTHTSNSLVHTDSLLLLFFFAPIRFPAITGVLQNQYMVTLYHQFMVPILNHVSAIYIYQRYQINIL